jgi:hypothetical protein
MFQNVVDDHDINAPTRQVDGGHVQHKIGRATVHICRTIIIVGQQSRNGAFGCKMKHVCGLGEWVFVQRQPDQPVTLQRSALRALRIILWGFTKGAELSTVVANRAFPREYTGDGTEDAESASESRVPNLLANPQWQDCPDGSSYRRPHLLACGLGFAFAIFPSFFSNAALSSSHPRRFATDLKSSDFDILARFL